MIKGIAHICIVASDLKAVEAFYCGILGLVKRFEYTKNGGIVGMYIAVPGRSFIEVFPADAVPSQAGPVRHFCLEVEDIDALIVHLRSKGYQVADKKRGSDESWQVWVKGPDGIDVEFHQYTPESHQITGELCYAKW